jgi:hypothetical protein
MHETVIQATSETFAKPAAIGFTLLEASKPYITVCLLVTILLSVWASLCAA